MAVTKEYRCKECNRIFDSRIPACIHCGSESVERIFITPIGIKGDKTKATDDHLDHLTASCGLSDYSNNLSTKHEADTSDVWQSYNPKTLGSDIARIAKPVSSPGKKGEVIPAAVSLAPLKPTMPNQLSLVGHEKIFHKQDPAAPK